MKNLPPLEWPFSNGNKVQIYDAAYPEYVERMKAISHATGVNFRRIENANQTQAR